MEPVIKDNLGEVLEEMCHGETKLMEYRGHRFQRVVGPENCRCHFWEHKPGYMKLIEEDDWPLIHALEGGFWKRILRRMR